MTQRVLVVHNFYRSANASGENLSVTDEIDGLRAAGWDVEVVSSDSDVIADGTIPFADLVVRPIYSRRSVERVSDAARRFRPHVALVENLFPLHSPAVIRVLRSGGVPVAAGVRSYRMFCAASTLFRDGKICRDCVGSRANLPAVVNGCYQSSPARTLPVAASLALHRGTFRSIDALLAVSDFVRDELVNAGFDADRVVIRPNFVADPGTPSGATGAGFVFAGRLTDDKGVGAMIEGWKRSEVWASQPLRIAGSGPLDPLVRQSDSRFRIDALGLVPHDRMLDIIRSAAVTVVPSAWPEPFGRGVIEAAARGRAALVSNVGGVASLVEDGVTGWISGLDPDDLAAGFRRAADPAAQISCGQAARHRFETNYSPDVSLAVLDSTLRRLAERGVDLDA